MRSIAFLMVCVLTALAVPTRAADNSPTTRPGVEEENAQLRKEIAKLREQLYEKDLGLNRLRLKQRLSALQPGQVVPPPMALTPAVPPNMPKGSVPQQFNGSTFYLVPLAETAVTATNGNTANANVTNWKPATELLPGCFIPQAK
jgi:hypothetical protein